MGVVTLRFVTSILVMDITGKSHSFTFAPHATASFVFKSFFSRKSPQNARLKIGAGEKTFSFFVPRCPLFFLNTSPHVTGNWTLYSVCLRENLRTLWNHLREEAE